MGLGGTDDHCLRIHRKWWNQAFVVREGVEVSVTIGPGPPEPCRSEHKREPCLIVGNTRNTREYSVMINVDMFKRTEGHIYCAKGSLTIEAAAATFRAERKCGRGRGGRD